MEISYDTILKILLGKDDSNPFFNKLNIIQYANEFTFFSELFDSTFYRYGIHQMDDNKNNISFWSSLLFCFDTKYFSKVSSDILSDIVRFKTNMIEDLKSTFTKTSNYIQDNTTFDNLRDIIKNNKTKNNIFLEIVVEYLKVNLLIFDFKDNTISSVYYSDFFNPWRPTIFLANYDDYWEPICSDEVKLFSFSSAKVNILKNKILCSDITYFGNLKEFNINDNLIEIIDIEHLVNDMDDNSDTLSENMFTTQKNLTKNLTKNKLNKMKKEDILELITELNLKVQFPKPTKKTLIGIICSHKNI